MPLPQDTTIQVLRAFANPKPKARVPGVETVAWRVNAVILGHKLEDDGDYHVVIASAPGGQTMIAEVVHPDCAGGAAWAKRAREIYEGVAGKPRKGGLQRIRIPVVITGVGFFDHPHGQDGVAPNAIELHPVITVARRKT